MSIIYPLVGSESLCHAQLDRVLNGKKVCTQGLTDKIDSKLGMTYLHASAIDIKGEVSVAHLKWCCLIINEPGPNDIEL